MQLLHKFVLSIVIGLMFPYNAFSQCATAETEIDIIFHATSTSYTAFWELKTASGTLLASGGNPLAFPGGQSATTASDPGAYPEDVDVVETVCVPEQGDFVLYAYSDFLVGKEYRIRYNGIEISKLKNHGYRQAVKTLEFSLPVPLVDASLETVLPNGVGTIQKGEHPIDFTVMNTGQTSITSLNLEWTIDGIVRTEQLTGINIAPGEQFHHVHAFGWDADTGSYTLSANISQINGAADDNTANNSLTISAQVQQVPNRKTVLLEQFSSTSCAPCVWTEAPLKKWYYDNNTSAILIKYEVGFAGGFDQLYQDNTLDPDERSVYYLGFSFGIPTTVINGNYFSSATNTLTDPILEDALQIRTLTSINDATAYLDGNKIKFSAAVQHFQLDTTENLVMHAVVVEKRIKTQPIGSNRATDHEWVMKKMVPDFNGTPLATFGQTVTPQFVSGEWEYQNVYDTSQLGVVFFVQNLNDQTVFQAKRVMVNESPDFSEPMDTAINDTTTSTNLVLAGGSTVNLFPNPANDVVNLKLNAMENQQIKLKFTDINGKQVKNLFIGELPKGIHNIPINVADLTTGVYLLHLDNGTSSITKRIMVSR